MRIFDDNMTTPQDKVKYGAVLQNLLDQAEKQPGEIGSISLRVQTERDTGRRHYVGTLSMRIHLNASVPGWHDEPVAVKSKY